MNKYTYSDSLRDDLENIPVEATSDVIRRLMNILDNTLCELSKHERALERIEATAQQAANTASCLANGIRPD